ncbi:MAG: 2-phosphosulfolactate phosphatase [Anaerolineales bacterium]|nr:MAG: 2-phosphosulfolactate phosphatase [Anaerolineales bacterium]
MKVFLKVGVPGAREAAARGDVIVVIDALRASVTITSALVVGAVKVIPVLTVAEARTYLDCEGYLVAGERGGVQIEGFHFGNSPTELWRQVAEVRGKTLILTTSSGTRCVEAAQEGAGAILAGALPNATALAQATFDLAGERGRDISLVAAGFNGQATVEDLFAARLIAHRLAVMGAVLTEGEWGDHPVENEAAEVLRDSPSGQKLRGLGYGKDVAFCAQIDVFEAVPIYRDDGFVV